MKLNYALNVTDVATELKCVTEVYF